MRLLAAERSLKIWIAKLFFFLNRRYSLLNFGGPQLYNSEALPYCKTLWLTDLFYYFCFTAIPGGIPIPLALESSRTKSRFAFFVFGRLSGPISYISISANYQNNRLPGSNKFTQVHRLYFFVIIDFRLNFFTNEKIWQISAQAVNT